MVDVAASPGDKSVRPEPTGERVLTLTGAGASLGTGIGPAVLVGGDVPEPPDTPFTGDCQPELARSEEALAAIAADLEDRGHRAGGEAQAVLEAQAQMARDPGLAQEVIRQVNEGRTAARAVYEAFGTYRAQLALAGDYMAARVADLDDIRDRVVARLLAVAVPGIPSLTTRSVLVARDLAPRRHRLVGSVACGRHRHRGGQSHLPHGDHRAGDERADGCGLRRGDLRDPQRSEAPGRWNRRRNPGGA
jgi:phosphoenolpyruvate-protein kinase (PTS system EI component)